ncbi:MAG TPA: malectin domain-containing carbohydrate-binding protein, partial [Flavisolibacter sp.]|nr:malectin domain-containing carbohydrate-binding protein [Flavisolibacter sp.]
YTTRFHQYYVTEMMKRPYVAAAMIWNLADFNSETRSETMPHINNKGLLQWDRTPKDPYYYYKAALSKTPFVKILGSGHSRFGVIDAVSGSCSHRVQVATNFDSILIIVNGQKQAVLTAVDGLAEGSVPFAQGTNTMVAEGWARGNFYRDSIKTNLHSPQTCLAKNNGSEELNVMLGSTRYYVDEKGAWWQPDRTYQGQAWGSLGGKKFKLEGNGRLPYGTDKNILGTEDDPIYQTQQTGIQQYKLDVPSGNYQLSLHFVELVGGSVPSLPYNLTDKEREEKKSRRIFNVAVNGKLFLQQFNIAAEHGCATAVVKTINVFVNENEGLQVDFEAIEGEPVLNALQLKRLKGQVSK